MKLLMVPVMLFVSLSAYGGGSDTSCNSLLKGKQFVFKAQWVSEYRSGQRHQLVPAYELVVNDSVAAYLPYYARVFTVPTDELHNRSLNFTSHSFSYKLESGKRKKQFLTIRPSDQRDLQSLTFTITRDCWCSLWIYSSARDPILYEGTIEELRE